jgi:hypothetical protein
MSLSGLAADLIRSRSRGSLTLRRVNTILPNDRTPKLKLAANLSAGASTLSAKSPNTSTLEGRVVQGAKLTIAGVTGTYTVTADAQSVAAGTIAISFSPVAAGPAAVDALITITQSYGDVSYPIITRNRSDQDMESVEGGRQVRFLPYDPTKPAPDINDRLDGITITEVETVDGDDGIAFYLVHHGVTP